MSECIDFLFTVKGAVSNETKAKMLQELEDSNKEYDNIFYKMFKRVPERIRSSSITLSIIESIGSGQFKYIDGVEFNYRDDGNTDVTIKVTKVFVDLYDSQKLYKVFMSKNAIEDIRKILKKKAIRDYKLELVSNGS